MEITSPQEAMIGVYSGMDLQRGCVFKENPRDGASLVDALTAHINLEIQDREGKPEQCSREVEISVKAQALSVVAGACSSPWIALP